MRDIRDVVTVIHTLVNRSEVDLNYYLDKAATLNSLNWSPETLPMIWLAGDERRLIEMAQRLAVLRLKMATPTGAENANLTSVSK